MEKILKDIENTSRKRSSHNHGSDHCPDDNRFHVTIMDPDILYIKSRQYSHSYAVVARVIPSVLLITAPSFLEYGHVK